MHLIYFVINISFAFCKILMAYYIEYQLLMKDQISLVMGLMLICVTISLPFWQWLAGRWTKVRPMHLGWVLVLWRLLDHFLPAASTDRFIYYILFALAGFGFAANWIFPWAMVADVADYDRAETGQQRSGMYYGVWGLATKISEALALAAVGWILTGFGYVPNVEQTPHALLGIRLFFGLIPAAFIFVPCRCCLNTRSPAKVMLKSARNWKQWTRLKIGR